MLARILNSKLLNTGSASPSTTFHKVHSVVLASESLPISCIQCISYSVFLLMFFLVPHISSLPPTLSSTHWLRPQPPLPTCDPILVSMDTMGWESSKGLHPVILKRHSQSTHTPEIPIGLLQAVRGIREASQVPLTCSPVGEPLALARASTS